MAKKIKRGSIPRLARSIPPASPPPDADSLRFSFKYLDLVGNAKFSIERCRDGYLKTFLERLRDLSRLTAKEFRTSRSRALRSHAIDFSETTEPQGFHALNEQLRAEQAWQFQLTANEHGRVHGILLLDTFYVVWIDLDHELYPARRQC
ncbi:MAG: hypothetical protein OXL41_12250 [Nitrospinae bacterium]|nr:hypothetical protein [Nitrospinota bacterium]